MDDVIARLDTARQASGIERALAALSAPQRRAVELRVEQDSSYSEIAEALGCSAGSARVLVFRGLRTLNRLLGDADAACR